VSRQAECAVTSEVLWGPSQLQGRAHLMNTGEAGATAVLLVLATVVLLVW
jgi:hypothetical protein